MNRRYFTKLGALTASSMLVSTPLGARTGKSRRGYPFSTSCVSWCFHDFNPGTDTTTTIDQIKDLGFDGIQLMINSSEDLDTIWTSEKVRSVRSHLSKIGLQLSSLAPFFPCYPHLGHSDRALRQQSLADFARFCRLAAELGTSRLEMLSPYVSEFVDGTNEMYQAPYGLYKLRDGTYQPGMKLHLDRADDVEWEAITTRMKGVFEQLSRIARRNNLTIVLEPHIHGFIAETSGFLLAKERYLGKTFRLNSDTGWTTMQTEYPPMSLLRAKDYLDIVQFRDVGKDTRMFTAFNQGVVDFGEVLRVLGETRFAGILSFEEVFIDTAAEDATRFLAFVKSYFR